jgi:hypothetical protein
MGRLDYVRKEYSIETIAYLAGIIDGEGSIYIGNFSSNPVTGNKYYQTNMEVTNTDKSLTDWLHFNFGGVVNTYTAKQLPKNSRKAVFRWIASGERMTHLCELLLPFLICKKKQCEIMLKMRATYAKLQYKKGKAGVLPHTKELLDLRQSLMNEMRSLHCRNYSK